MRPLWAFLIGLAIALSPSSVESEEPIGGPATVLAAASGEELGQLQWRLARSAAEEIRSAGTRESWSGDELDALVGRLLVDQTRLESDDEFKARVLPIAASALPADVPESLRDLLLARLSVTPGIGLFDLEAIEAGWGTVQRRSSERRLETSVGERRWGLGFAHVEAPIAASVYSLTGTLFELSEADTFLRAVRERAPKRSILVLADHPLSSELAPLASTLGLDLLRTWSRSYSPWPRDPMSLLWGGETGAVLALRPNRQPTRELDSGMGLELIQELPSALDDRLGGLRWTVAPVPFHNGNMLPTRDTLWISLHTLEPRILEVMGVDRVPVQSFITQAGVTNYLRAARRAARELQSVFGTRVEYVHPLPNTSLPSGELQVQMRRLGGGAGFDLDSVVTFLPAPREGASAAVVVGKPSLGAELVQSAGAEELEEFARAYGLAPRGTELAERLARAQDTPRPRGLEGYLDLVASHFEEMGVTVRRAPLLLVPTSFLTEAARYPDENFLIGWNNVVLDSIGGQPSAEGFAARLASGDKAARELFAELGYTLELFPPLIESVLRNGGYRCASSHVRAR